MMSSEVVIGAPADFTRYSFKAKVEKSWKKKIDTVDRNLSLETLYIENHQLWYFTLTANL